MMTPHDQLIAWLNDAYSMERSLAKVLESQLAGAADFPEIQSHLQQHLIETRGHAEQVAACLTQMGQKPSMAKGAVGSMMGMVEGAATGVFRDALLKSFVMDYAAEHMEIACYEALVAAANELGLPEIAAACEAILADEISMATWLEQRIPEVTAMSLRELAEQP
jgi:ferritin-like metal-binding protein YciE